MTDIVIPLGPGSRFKNDELRLALRSIVRNGRNIGRIRIFSTCAPDWLRNVEIVEFPDRYRSNKDANLIDKLRAAAAGSERFIFWSDDQIAVNSFDADALRPVAADNGIDHFTAIKSPGKWQRRMLRTLRLLQRRCAPVVNWESHVPQPHCADAIFRAIEGVNYQTEPGYCVNTLIYGLNHVAPDVWQHQVKTTVESAGKIPDEFDKIFVGFNDAGFAGALRRRLFEMLPETSPFER